MECALSRGIHPRSRRELTSPRRDCGVQRPRDFLTDIVACGGCGGWRCGKLINVGGRVDWSRRAQGLGEARTTLRNLRDGDKSRTNGPGQDHTRRGRGGERGVSETRASVVRSGRFTLLLLYAFNCGLLLNPFHSSVLTSSAARVHLVPQRARGARQHGAGGRRRDIHAATTAAVEHPAARRGVDLHVLLSESAGRRPMLMSACAHRGGVERSVVHCATAGLTQDIPGELYVRKLRRGARSVALVWVQPHCRAAKGVPDL